MIDWTPAQPPVPRELSGRYVSLRPVQPDDAEALFEASRDPAIWTYLPYGPYATLDDFRGRVAEMIAADDTLYFTLRVDGVARGIASYGQIKPVNGSIEIGDIWFGTPLQRTREATEAIYLLAKYAMDDLGYRRFEWRCNALNAKSRRAAERFGFTFEGIFRNHMVIKGQNRDTAWFSITDYEWPPIRAAFEEWLAHENFDERGVQRRPLQTRGE